MAERIHKVLARAGLGSRRTMESWITEGRVSVNGETATLGASIGRTDRVVVDGKPIAAEQLFPSQTRVLALNKPAGVICTRADDANRPTVFELLPRGKWVAVGRLDFNTIGLMLFTNNGDLAHRLMHPSRGFKREYRVRVLGGVSEAVLDRLRQGVELDDGMAQLESIVAMAGSGVNRWYQVTLSEGRNREVRRMFESQGATVSRLLRTAYGPVRLRRDVRAGSWWEMDADEIRRLMQLTGLVAMHKTLPRRTRRRR